MVVPAVHAATLENWWIARTFLYHAVFFAFLGMILGVALMNRRPRIVERYHLMTLLLTYALLPVVLALPLGARAPASVSGGLFRDAVEPHHHRRHHVRPPELLAEPLHLWRALVGWLGGLLILVAAFADARPAQPRRLRDQPPRRRRRTGPQPRQPHRGSAHPPLHAA
jgi:trk system potassium uptake protein